MLNRLQAKGVLRRRKEGNKSIYAPAAPGQSEREAALRRLSRDYFGGSLSATASTRIDLLRAERPESRPASGDDLRFPRAAGGSAAAEKRSR